MRSSCTFIVISNVSQSGSSTGFNLKIIKSLVQRFFSLLSPKILLHFGQDKIGMKKGWWGTYQRGLQRKSVRPKAQCEGRNKRKCSFRCPDTKSLCCYLVSLLAWGTSSSCTVPVDIRSQFLLCRTCPILPPLQMLLYIVLGFFLASQNPEKCISY